ncbi:MAG: GNAT family N-acetyltransferase, partial [Chloroflexota bacterium]
QLISLWYKASKIAHPFLSDNFLEKEKNNLRTIFLPNSETWVFEADEQITGFVSLLENTVGGIFIHPAWQRKGIGSKLLNHALQTRPYLKLEVFEANHQGRAFYKKFGFVQIAMRLDEATDQVLLELRYEKEDK